MPAGVADPFLYSIMDYIKRIAGVNLGKEETSPRKGTIHA
jgi:hypothetical protein